MKVAEIVTEITASPDGAVAGDRTIRYVEPQWDREWPEAARYPEFEQLGQDEWKQLARTGRAVTISSARGINNTDATDPGSFSQLDPHKQARALQQLDSGIVEMPIVAVYSDGWRELIAGNTRLTALLAHSGTAVVWMFDVPDAVALLATNPAAASMDMSGYNKD